MRDQLAHRAALLRRVRAFFDDAGFLEVETPALSPYVVGERHMTPWIARGLDDAGDGAGWFLQPSPEAAMKQLLAAGSGSIYQVGKAFRFGEVGPRHHPEFTMVEWYSVDDDYAAGLDRLDRLLRHVAAAPPAERRSYREAFARELAVDPLTAEVDELVRLAHERTTARFEGDVERDDLLNLLLAECIEPRLGRDAPTILYDYPASQAALAKTGGAPPVARRFEAYWRGVELANGYDELTDADELERRQKEVDRQRRRDGRTPTGRHEPLLAALRSGLPNCVGVALGFDRLAMLAAGAQRLDGVLPGRFDWS